MHTTIPWQHLHPRLPFWLLLSRQNSPVLSVSPGISEHADGLELRQAGHPSDPGLYQMHTCSVKSATVTGIDPN